MRRPWAAPASLAILLLALAACATAPPATPVRHAAAPYRPAGAPTVRPRPYDPPHGPSPAAAVSSRPLAPPERSAVAGSLADLPGWADDDHAAALAAFAASCGPARDPDLRAVCSEARAAGPLNEIAARRFLEARFRPAPLPGEGVLTAYFSPEYEARTAPDGAFSAPVRPRPVGGGAVYAPVDDPTALLSDTPPPMVAGSLLNADRATIEQTSAPEALAWMRPEDLFFLQIQGSGTLVFETGRRAKAAYAGDNGRPFTAIARPMAELGLLPRTRVGGEDIRRWLADHAGADADAVMRRNARYVFFQLSPDDAREPLGSAGVPLTPGRSLAIDPSQHGYGELFWIDADAPVLAGATKRYRRLAVALDKGSAIRGEVRADLYTGRGDEAGREAGRVRHTLRLVRLAPIPARER